MPFSPLGQPAAGPADPASAPTGDPGAMADSMSKVRTAVQLLETALPGIPLGTEPHKAVLSAIQSLSKTVPSSEAVPGVQMTQLAGLSQQAQQSAPLQALVRQLGQGPAVQPVGQ